MSLLSVMQRLFKKDRILAIAVFNLLTRLKGPVSIGLFDKLASTYMGALVYVNVQQSSAERGKEEAKHKENPIEEIDYQGPEYKQIMESYMPESLFEFSVELDKFLCYIHEFMIFSLKIPRGHEFYTKESPWSDNKHFPQMALSWLENRTFKSN